MEFPYELLAVPKVQVPALVTRLPLFPVIRMEPSGDKEEDGGGGGEAGGGGGGELGNPDGFDEAPQPNPFHSHQPRELSA